MRKSVILFIPFILLACDKGLEPPPEGNDAVSFSVEPQGGNPNGIWIPRQERPLEVFIVDDSSIPNVVDSLAIGTNLEGVFRFEVTGACSVSAVITLVPEVYITGVEDPIILTIQDTLTANGFYDLQDEKILIIPGQTRQFSLDTLGFSSYTDSLDLISLNTMFSYEGAIEFPIYFIFHLVSAAQVPDGQLPFRTRRQNK